jgi:hypothetical protein
MSEVAMASSRNAEKQAVALPGNKEIAKMIGNTSGRELQRLQEAHHSSEIFRGGARDRHCGFEFSPRA